MQPAGPTPTPQQTDLHKTMQPPPQQLYAPSSGSNGTGNIRPSQQTTTIYRGPPTSTAPRNGSRHLPMQTMFQQSMHQGVVVPTYPQFGPRPTYQGHQYPYSQTMQPYYSSYQYFQPMQQPQTHRGPVGVNPGVGVNVGNAISVQSGPNVPPGAAQTQMSITGGAVITGPAPPGSNAVLGVASPGPGQQQVAVGMPSMVGVTVPGTLPTQAIQTKGRLRKHALQIIDPDTNRNILEDIDLSKSASNAEVDNQEQITTMSAISPEVQIVSAPSQQDLTMSTTNVSNPLVMSTDNRAIFNIDMHQLQQQRDVAAGQTPVVSAMSDAPSVEIRPTLQKPRNKKIIPIAPPKEEHDKSQSLAKSSEDSRKQQHTKKTDETSIKLVNVQQLPHTSQVPQESPEDRNKQSGIQASHSETQHSNTLSTVTTASFTASNTQIPTDNSINNTNNENSTNQSPADYLTTAISYSSSTIENQQIGAQSENRKFGSGIIDNTNTSVIETATKSIATEEVQSSLNNMKLNEKETTTTSEAPTGVFNETDVTTTNGNSSKSADQITTTKEALYVSSKAKQSNNSVEANHRCNIDVATTRRLNKNEVVGTINKPIASESGQIASDASDHSAVPILPSEPTKDGTNNNDDEKLANGESTNTNLTQNTNVSSITTVSETNEVPVTTKNNKPYISTSAPASIPIAPLINYNEGQWSPQNPTGKKQYDREQLLQLREAKASRIQPEVSNVSILPQPNMMPSFARGNNNNNKRVQSMVGSIGGNRSGDSGNYISKQASMSGVNARSSSKGGMIHVNLSLNQDVKLNETDNAWRPRALVGGKDGEIDPSVQTQREKDELIRSVRGILNKLTPEKFDALVEEIIKLKIDTPDKMEDVMVLVFEKAIDEPNFSVSYARLCHRLITEVKARDERMESGTKTNLAHFRNALLDKTEREFTQNVSKRATKEQKLQPIMDRIKSCGDLTEKVELQALLEEEERKIRRRSGGTVRFIGELFKISMLTGKIINHCIDMLLEPKTEDMLECLCKLLTTVGAKFEQTPMNSKDPSGTCFSLDRIIARMQAIASRTDKEGSKISSRVRFMLQDVIDLRKNKWQSSRNEAPKTMEQIEKETKTEQLSSQYLNYGGMLPGSGNSSASGNQNSGKRDDRGGGGGRYNDSRSSGGYGGSHSQRGDSGSLRRQHQSGMGGNSGGAGSNSISGGNNDDNTWHVQTSKGSRSLAVDTNKLEGLLTHNLDMGSKKMGAVQQFIWNNAQRQSPQTTTPSNSFAVLSSLVDTNKSSSDRDRDRGGPRNKGSYNKGSMERDRYNDRGIHSRTGSSQGSRENSSSRGNQGGRGMMNASSMQKSASHKNYSQPMVPRMSGKSSGISSMSSANALHPLHRGEHAHQPSQQRLGEPTNAPFPSAAPAAVFEEPNDVEKNLMKSVVTEMIELAAKSKTVTAAIVPCINRIKEKQRCGLLYYILADYLHLANVGVQYRRYIAQIVIYLIKYKFISVEHFQLAYDKFCDIASDLIYDVPELWLYFFEFAGPLIMQQIIALKDLWNKLLQEDDSPKLGQKFLKSYLVYCTREIGPSYTRSMWKKFNMKWEDFMPESEVQTFIETNKFEYIENEASSPEIIIKDSNTHVAKVVERVESLLNKGFDQNTIIDYINGNIMGVDKHFIRSLTTVISNFAIKDSSFKLDIDSFQKVCIPVLQRYIDSNEERELECLHAMQLLVHSLEHPRGLLNELFFELYDSDVIPQESFIKWRDSKDQSAGKGVAVKGLNPFFNDLLSGETSD